METWLTEYLAEHGGICGTVHAWDGDALALRAAVNIPPSVIARTQRIPPGKGMAGLAFTRRRAVQTCNLQADESGDVRPGARAVSAQAAVALPVFGPEAAVVAVVGIAFLGERELGKGEVHTLSTSAAALPMSGERPAPSPLARIVRRVCPDAWPWFDQALEGTAPPLDPDRFAGRYAGTGRRLGSTPVTLMPAEAKALGHGGWPTVEGWGADEVGRAALLIAAVHAVGHHDQVPLVEDLYLRGSTGERTALLRSLPALPEPNRFLRIAIESCRTNVEPIFRAIALNNEYPRDHFPDPGFHQLVLKTIFLGLPSEEIVGLERRTTPELVRMVEGYGSERAAAGRSVPHDIARIRVYLEAKP